MRDYMAPRGPDGAGAWVSEDERVALGHRRLAIIDLSERAAQPMRSHDGKLVVTFNGEIYNHVALRRKLEAGGHRFRTASDTEVLLHMYRQYGCAMLTHLRGMFAFALWDSERKGLLLARDFFGIKPLYFADDGRTFRFASQVGALLAGGQLSRQRDPAGQVGFLLWGSVPEPFTIYQSVHTLEAGNLLWVEGARAVQPRAYVSLSETWTAACHEQIVVAKEGQERFSAAVRESVRHHLEADVPVGLFLSAGIDSGALVGLMAEHSAEIQAITLGFAEFEGTRNDEVPLASQLAERYGAAHRVRRIGREEFDRDLPAILSAMDQPSIDGFNTWFVSKAAAEAGLKVAISGLGGDELLGGYGSFRDVPRLVRASSWAAALPELGPVARTAFVSVARRLPKFHPKLAGVLEYGHSYQRAYFLKRGLFMPWELDSLLGPELVAEGLARLDLLSWLGKLLRPEPPVPYACVAALEASVYMRNQLLRDADWASMAHSLEVRVPLVDATLLSQAAPLLMGGLWRRGKQLLAHAPKPPLPRSVSERPKTGFSTPVAQWLSATPRLEAWRRVASLRRSNTPWARRLAFTLLTDAWPDR